MMQMSSVNNCGVTADGLTPEASILVAQIGLNANVRHSKMLSVLLEYIIMRCVVT